MRGNREWEDRRRTQCRSIPACAGEPLASLANLHYLGLSPRVRGNPWHARRRLTVAWAGLSPRVRGNRRRQAEVRQSLWRSIPACAGEPPLRLCPVCTVIGLSPRVRGNHRRSYSRHQVVALGLSPRVRGNLQHPPTTLHPDSAWSIPACAGEPKWTWVSTKEQVRRSIPACAGEPCL